MQALIYVDEAMRAAGIDGGVVLFIHDEIVVECLEADAEYVEDIITRAMTRAFSETFPDAPLNGLVETRVATAWGPRDERDTIVEDAGTGPVAGDAGGTDLPARGVSRPEDGGDAAPPEAVRRRAGRRRAGAGGLVDVPPTGNLTDENFEYDADESGKPDRPEKQAELDQWKAELSAALLARTCDRCGRSPCMVFGEHTTFCTLECWEASGVRAG
jgi:hypothetical protein